MSTIITIAPGDQITNSLADINTNFSNLNTDKFETSNVDTDSTLAANSDTKVASQKAIKAYIAAGGGNASTTAQGVVQEATTAQLEAGTAAGSTGARLFVNPSTAFPNGKIDANLALNHKAGIFTRADNTADGNTVVAHGLGRTPVTVKVRAVVQPADAAAAAVSSSEGVYTVSGTTYATVYTFIRAATGAFSSIVGNSTSKIINLEHATDGNTRQTATLTVDATNLTFAWVKGGTPDSSTCSVMWETW